MAADWIVVFLLLAAHFGSILSRCVVSTHFIFLVLFYVKLLSCVTSVVLFLYELLGFKSHNLTEQHVKANINFPPAHQIYCIIAMMKSFYIKTSLSDYFC